MLEQNIIEPQFIEKSLFVKFESKKHEIDAHIVGQMILAFNTTLKSLAAKNNSERVDIKIKAFQKGSFELPVIISAAATLPDSLNFFAHLYENIKNLYDLFKFLASKPAKSMEELDNNRIKVENHIGEKAVFNNCIVTTYNCLPQSPLGDAEKLRNDTNISGISLLDGEKKAFTTIHKDDFHRYEPHKKVILHQDDAILEEEEEAELYVSEIELYKMNKTWGFFYNGNRIRAKVLDDKFKEQINKGHPFRKGDKLKVVLTKTKVYDASIHTYLIKKYEINQIIEYFPVSSMEHPPLNLE